MLLVSWSSSSSGGSTRVGSGSYLWPATDPKELKISNLGNGYRDITARIDLNTYRRTFTTPSLPFFLLTFIEPDNGETLCACPRGALQRVIKDLNDEGLEAYAGAEVRQPRGSVDSCFVG
jgi:glutamine synthetase